MVWQSIYRGFRKTRIKKPDLRVLQKYYNYALMGLFCYQNFFLQKSAEMVDLKVMYFGWQDKRRSHLVGNGPRFNAPKGNAPVANERRRGRSRG